MKKVTILVGENIASLSFQQGGYARMGLVVENGCPSKWVYSSESTSRKCPEDSKHPRVYQQLLIKDIEYCLPYWSYIVSTNTMHTINIISDLVRKGVLSGSDVDIVGLNKDNDEIIFTAGLDSEGYLTDDWHIGFLSLD